jgi:isoleucyl-tRNA synthetase
MPKSQASLETYLHQFLLRTLSQAMSPNIPYTATKIWLSSQQKQTGLAKTIHNPPKDTTDTDTTHT